MVFYSNPFGLFFFSFEDGECYAPYPDWSSFLGSANGLQNWFFGQLRGPPPLPSNPFPFPLEEIPGIIHSFCQIGSPKKSAQGGPPPSRCFKFLHPRSCPCAYVRLPAEIGWHAFFSPHANPPGRSAVPYQSFFFLLYGFPWVVFFFSSPFLVLVTSPKSFLFLPSRLFSGTDSCCFPLRTCCPLPAFG